MVCSEPALGSGGGSRRPCFTHCRGTCVNKRRLAPAAALHFLLSAMWRIGFPIRPPISVVSFILSETLGDDRRRPRSSRRGLWTRELEPNKNTRLARSSFLPLEFTLPFETLVGNWIFFFFFQVASRPVTGCDAVPKASEETAAERRRPK